MKTLISLTIILFFTITLYSQDLGERVYFNHTHSGSALSFKHIPDPNSLKKGIIYYSEESNIIKMLFNNR